MPSSQACASFAVVLPSLLVCGMAGYWELYSETGIPTNAGSATPPEGEPSGHAAQNILILADAAYASLQLFVLEGPTLSRIPLTLQIARFLAPMATLIGVLGALPPHRQRNERTTRWRH